MNRSRVKQQQRQKTSKKEVRRLASGNEKNLIPNSQRTPEELREMTRKGGIASGKARRRKANLKKAMVTLLSMNVQSDKSRALLEAMGLEPTNEMLLAVTTFQQAVKGNQRAMENVMKLSTTEKDRLDESEQRERIKAQKMKNKQLAENGGREAVIETVVFMNESNIPD